MRVAALFSGGKDSTLAIYWAVLQGWDVACLVSLKSQNPDSYMFHTPNMHMVEAQAQAMEIPIIIVVTSGKREYELDDLRAALIKAKDGFGITGILTGAILSNYQEERINRICYSVGLKTFSPLWHKDQIQLLEDLVSSRFKIMLTSVAADGFGQEFLGKDVDVSMIKKFKDLNVTYGINPAGEGGEFETFVYDCPLFKKAITITSFSIVMKGYHTGYVDIQDYNFVDKSIA
ncbi:MAG: diphthine--ammonia ligase [Nanoarchaeota archaeon]